MVTKSPAVKPSKVSAVEVRAEGVRKAFGDHVVLRDISLDILRGQIVAIVGASGSGKTVFLDILTGLLPPDTGRVLVSDHSRPRAPLVDLATLNSDELDRIRMYWAIVFQHNALFTGSVYDNIALWLREHTKMSERAIRDRVRQSLRAASLDVDDVIEKDRDELSGGMAKRVAIARAVAVDPLVIFYDEPSTGLDPITGAQVHELIFRNHHRPVNGKPRTSIVITHDKELLRRVRPRVVMLHHGSVAFDGAYDEFAGSDSPIAREYLRAMPVLQAREEDPHGPSRHSMWG